MTDSWEAGEARAEFAEGDSLRDEFRTRGRLLVKLQPDLHAVVAAHCCTAVGVGDLTGQSASSAPVDGQVWRPQKRLRPFNGREHFQLFLCGRHCDGVKRLDAAAGALRADGKKKNLDVSNGSCEASMVSYRWVADAQVGHQSN